MTPWLKPAPAPVPVDWWTDTFLPWLVGISTLVGVLAAITAGIFAGLAYRREVLRDRARDVERRAAHAAGVVAWFYTESSGLDPDELGRVRVAVDNTSNLPAYGAQLYWYLKSGTLADILAVARSGKKPLPDWIQGIGHVPPGGKLDLGIEEPGIDALRRAWKPREPGDDPIAHIGSVTFELRFFDAAGIPWVRRHDGRLEERRSGGLGDFPPQRESR